MHLTQLEDQARMHLIAGNDRQAYELLMKLINTEEHNDSAYYLLSIIARKYHNYPKELEMLTIAQELNKQSIDYQVYFARALAMVGESDTAKLKLDSIDQQKIQTPELIDAVASTYNKLYLYTKACQWYMALIDVDKTNPYAFFNLGTCYKFCGKFREAQEAFVKAVELKPNYYKAHAALSSFASYNQQKNDIERLIDLRKQTQDLDAKLHLSHAISKEYDAQQDYQQAFTSLVDAKKNMKAQLNYQFCEDAKLFTHIEQAMTKITAPETVESVSDIFVVGMPRTGTTLVERLLSGHPNVVSGGELYHFNMALKKVLAVNDKRFASPECFTQFNQDAAVKIGELYKKTTSYLHKSNEVLLNKLPLNVLYASQILDALPNAVMVCLDREPLDTVVGNYRQLFSFDDRANLYTLDLIDTANYTLAFRQLIEKLAQHYPSRFYVINYQNLVNNPQQQARRLYQFCGLQWDDKYLATEKNKQPVATASSLQVREKIHTKSIGQSQRYSSFLAEVQNILAQQQN